MNPRNTVRSRIFLLLFLLSIPALACTTLLGGSDDGDTVGSADESQQASSPEEQESFDDSSAGDEGAADSAAAESTAGSGEATVDSRETIVSALRTGLEIDRMRMYISSEDATSGVVTDVTLTIVRPNHYHLVSEELELIVIDDTTYLKGPDGEWTTMAGTEMISTVEGTLAAFAGQAAVQERLDTLSDSNVAIGGTETINGVETRIYTINEGLEESSLFGRVKMWIGVEDGLLYRQEVATELGGVGGQTTMEFEYGDDVTIEPPAP